MPTSFIHFTKEPSEDITNAPQYYHNFNGAPVRVRAYWTAPVVADRGRWMESKRLLRAAAALLHKYTLRLDVLPAPAPPAVHAALRAKAIKSATPADRKAAKAVQRIDQRLGEFNRSSLGTLTQLIGVPAVPSLQGVLAQAFDDKIDDDVAAKEGMISYPYKIDIPHERDPSIETLRDVRKLIDPVSDEKRLVVVFAPLEPPGVGYTALAHEWLPWVLVDPSPQAGDSTLLHEIGHACRLAHQQFNAPADPQRDYSKPSPYRNVMTYGEICDQLWGWQVDTIYDSYWCTGPRPTKWWERKVQVMDAPFLWDEPS